MMTNKVATMVEKAKDAMKGSGTSGLRKFVRKDLKDVKDRVDAVHMMVVRNVELKLISEDVAAEQMNSLYSYADNLLETWFMQVDNTIEFYNDLKENLFADKDFSKLTDDDYKCLKLIVKERTKLQRLSAEIQAMVCYVDTMLEDFGYLDDLDMDDDDEEYEITNDEEIHAYIKSVKESLSRARNLSDMISATKGYNIEVVDDPKLSLYIDDENHSIITITVTSDNVVHVSGSDELYTLNELEEARNNLKNATAISALNRLLKITLVDEKDNEEDDTNEETK